MCKMCQTLEEFACLAEPRNPTCSALCIWLVRAATIKNTHPDANPDSLDGPLDVCFLWLPSHIEVGVGQRRLAGGRRSSGLPAAYPAPYPVAHLVRERFCKKRRWQ